MESINILIDLAMVKLYAVVILSVIVNFKYFIMYSLLQKKDNAHDESVWTCAWSRIGEKANKTDYQENSRDSVGSSDGVSDFIITGGLDDLVKIWQVRNDKLELRHKLSGHTLGIISVDVNSTGSLIASTSLDSSLRLWDVLSGQEVIKMESGPVDVWTVVFSPDDKHVITGSDGKITMYGVESGKQEQVIDTRGKFTLSIAYSPDGKYIASGEIDGNINIFDVTQGKLVHTLGGHAMPIRGLCFSPNSQYLLTASEDGLIKVYDILHANVTGTLSGHASWVLSVAFSPDGKQFASSSSDKTVKIWDFNTRTCVHTFQDHTDQVWCVKYNHNNDKVISVSEDKSVNMYNCPPIKE